MPIIHVFFVSEIYTVNVIRLCERFTRHRKIVHDEKVHRHDGIAMLALAKDEQNFHSSGVDVTPK